MIAPAKARSAGFTLLEMIIALFIIMLLLGMAVFSTRNILADQELRDAARELQVFAKTARKQAMDSNQTQELLLQSDSWQLAQAPDLPSGTGEAEPKIQEYKLPENIHWKIKKWGSSEWETPKETSWPFSSSGLCSPFRFRFERKESWVEFSVNPLTANSQDEDFYLP